MKKKYHPLIINGKKFTKEEADKYFKKYPPKKNSLKVIIKK